MGSDESHFNVSFVMERSGEVGQDTGSGVNKVETTAGVWQQSGLAQPQTIFSTPKI